MMVLEQLNELIQQLRGKSSEDVYHRLLEQDASCIPLLMDAFHHEADDRIAGTLVEIIWQYRIPETITFLAEQLTDPRGEVWKSALDGLVAIGDEESIALLRRAKQPLDSLRIEWIDEAIQQITDHMEGSSHQ